MRDTKGRFKEGNKGKPKGSLNKSTKDIRNAYTKLLGDNLEQLQEDFKELDPKDRIKLFLDMSKYIMPQLKATELDIGEETLKKFNKPLAEFFGIET